LRYTRLDTANRDKEIMEAHGGSISVTSQVLKGSIFTLRLRAPGTNDGFSTARFPSVPLWQTQFTRSFGLITWS